MVAVVGKARESLAMAVGALVTAVTGVEATALGFRVKGVAVETASAMVDASAACLEVVMALASLVTVAAVGQALDWEVVMVDFVVG